MAQALKFYDSVVGVDVHLVMVPGAPMPVPLPHAFIGIVLDPLGKLIDAAMTLFIGGGPVWINGVNCGNTGTRAFAAPHLPTPPGIAFAPVDIPTHDGTIVSGSKTVRMAGSMAGRTGSHATSCSFPVQMPSSLCFALPAGRPVEIGGPEGWDAVAIALGMIRTKWVSNHLHRLLRVPVGSRRSKVLCFLTGHPVDVVTGAVSTEAEDFALPGPIPLVWERNYCSRDVQVGALGPGWSHSLEVGLREEERWLWLRLADGRTIRHARLAVGAAVWEPSERYSLRRAGEDSYVLEDTCGLSFELVRTPGAAWSCPLVRVVDRDGNAWRMTYVEGRLEAAEDSAGRRLGFVHDRRGRLRMVRMWLASREEWAPLVGYVYGEDGTLAAAIDAEGRASRYLYRGGVLVRETDRKGLSFHFEYDWEHPEGWCIRTWGDGGIFARTLRYDKYARVTEVEDGRGGRTLYFGNAAGLVDRLIDAAGAVWSYEWEPELLCRVAEVDPLGRRWAWEYDQRGNLRAAKDPLGRTMRFRLDEEGELVEAVDARGHSRRWEYDARGHVRRAIDACGSAWSFGYDGRGNLVEAVDPLGRAIRAEVGAAGEVLEVRDREGHPTRLEYDEFGRVIRRVGALGGETRLVWDACGRLTELVRADGSRVSLEYDGEGNLVRLIDGLGHAWTLEIGGHDKVVGCTDPLGGRVTYRLDCEDEVVAVTNERGEESRVERDACGRATREIGFDGRVRSFGYDQAGDCVEVVNGRGQRTVIVRDALGRAVEQRGSDGVRLRFAYDACGGLIEASNADCEVRFERDACGRVTLERAGADAVVSEYDALGARVRRVASRGGEVLYEYDGESELVRVRVPRPGGESVPEAPDLRTRDCWEIEVVRDAEGREVARRLPGGVEARWRRDVMGRPVVVQVLRHPQGLAPAWSEQSVVSPPPQELLRSSYEWRAESRLAAVHDLRRGTTRFTHDARGVLMAAEHPDGRVERRVMDASGDLYRTEDRSDREYGPGGRLLAADGVRFEYDADGNMVGQIAADGATWRYTWDSLGQLVRVDRSRGSSTLLVYDACARRIERVDEEAGRLSFRWDLGEIAWEASEAGERAWIAGEDALPQASVSSLGFSSHIAGLAGEKFSAWAGGADAFAWLDLDGVVRGAEGPVDPWRWPGQYEDPGLGLYYNQFRYYVAGVGAYASQDPLQADLHAYRYVLDPLVLCDPLGLAWSPKMLQDALAVLRTHEGAIQEVFGCEVQVGIRGSLVDGIRFKTGTPFRSEFFDVDAFVVTRSGRQGFPKAIYQGDKLAAVLKLETVIKKALLELDGFSGMVKQGGFGFKVWRKIPSGAVTTGGDWTPREARGRRPGCR